MMQSQRCVEELFSFSFYIPLLTEAGNVCGGDIRVSLVLILAKCLLFLLMVLQVAVFAPSRSSPYVTITLKTMFEVILSISFSFNTFVKLEFLPKFEMFPCAATLQGVVYI